MKKLITKALAVLLICLFVISGFNFSILADNTVQTDEKLAAINLGISGKISLMFYFTNIDEISGFRVTVGSGEVSFVDKSELKYDSAKGRYLLTVKLAAAQQTDLVTLQAIDKNGNASSTVRQYSIRDYANKLLNLASSNSAYAVAAETVKFMLNYGAMAQKHFNYNAGNLANEGLYYRGTNPVDDMSYEDMYGIAAPSSYPLKENASQKPIWDVIHFTHVNAYLEDTVSLRFYFEYNGTKELEVWIGYIDSNGNTADSTKYENEILQDENGDYYVLINNIPSTCFNKQYSVLISEGTDNYAVMNYSVLNYVQAALASTDSETLRNVAYSMFQFYVCSSAYAGTPAPGFTAMSSACSHERTYTDAHLGNAVLCSDCAYNKGASGYFNLEGNTITANRGTANEFAYQATGYTEAYGETGLYVPAGQKLVITGDKIYSSTLTNRFHLQYYASVPVKLTMTYSHGGTTTDEIYYMEAGENTFSAVDYSFLASNGGGAENDKVTYYKDSSNFTLSKITVEPVESGKDMNFVLFHYYAETVNPSLTQVKYNEKTCYLSYVQDAHYKLGINLTWGGAISELYDLTASSGSINSGTNLINASDTGRLIQQSYYGTNGDSDPNYTPHYWKSRDDLPYAKWSYNPVQGGDANNNQSRIIDFETGSDYIYIKAQPLDWANHVLNANGTYTQTDSRFTFCYIENRYTLKGDYIQVDNRMVDFSGYTHPYTTQELPAFYTLAYFDDYYWYNGSDPWNLTSGTANLTREDNLPFWGDTAKFAETTFNYQVSNTETWGAFVNESTLYGLGMYVPNIDVIKGGRLDGSEENKVADATSGYTSYFAPLKTLKIVCYEPIEYSYLLCAGNINTIRSVFTANQNFASNYSLNENSISQKIPDEINLEYIDFSDKTNALFVRDMTNTISSFDASVGAVRLDVTAGDPYFHLNYSLYDTVYTADNYDYIEFEYMIPAGVAGRNYQAQLFYCVGNVLAVDGAYNYFPINLTADGQFHTARINTSDLGAAWTGKLNQLRVDFLHEAAAGDVFYIRSVKLGKANSYILNSGFADDALRSQIVDGYGEHDNSSISATVNTNYVTVTKSHANGAYFTVRTNTESTNNETGQYLVMKYRTDSASLKNFNIFASTSEYSAKDGAVRFDNSHLISDGEWHITYIDLSQMSSVVPSADGKYYLKYFRLDMTEAMAVGESIDIAYVGLCNADALKMLSADSDFGYLEGNHRYHFQIDGLTNGTTDYITNGFVNSTTMLSTPVMSTNDKWQLAISSGWIALDNPDELAGLYYQVIDAKGNHSAWMAADGALREPEDTLVPYVNSTAPMNTYTDPTVKRVSYNLDLSNFGGQVTVVVAAAFWDNAVSGGVSIQNLWEFDVDLPTFAPQSIVTNATTAGQGHLIGAENLEAAKLTDGYLTLTKKSNTAGETYFSLLINSASDTVKIATGKYLAIKYRGNTSGAAYSQTYNIYASTNIYAAENGNQCLSNNKLTVDNEWHVAYFDLSQISDVAAVNGEYYINFVRFDFLTSLRVGDSVDIAYIDLFDATWHASIDQFLYDVDGNFEVVEGTINGASTNNVNGNTISVGETKYSNITANYVCISAGWLAVDGYDISALNCKIYNADGTLLSTVACNLDPAESGVVTHVSGMGYGEGTVPYRIVSANAPFVVVDLNAYKGQTVTVVYEATLVGAREAIEIIRINATVS
ncbi:MAG: hypothetical protein IJ345_06705 [Clostridia bacterium]|nr:hypothetical protein [Clostridia bacterium]